MGKPEAVPTGYTLVGEAGAVAGEVAVAARVVRGEGVLWKGREAVGRGVAAELREAPAEAEAAPGGESVGAAPVCVPCALSVAVAVAVAVGCAGVSVASAGVGVAAAVK